MFWNINECWYSKRQLMIIIWLLWYGPNDQWDFVEMEIQGVFPSSVFSIARKLGNYKSFTFSIALHWSEPRTVTRAVLHTRRMDSVMHCTRCYFHNRSWLLYDCFADTNLDSHITTLILYRKYDVINATN